jgi:hypothetical protein
VRVAQGSASSRQAPATLILLVNGSRANRAFLAQGRSMLAAAFPIRTRAVLEALGSGRDPGGMSIVLL